MSNEGSSSVHNSISSNTREKDIGWNYCRPATENSTTVCICNFCNKTTRGGITRLKEHLMGKKGNVAVCKQCPKEVRDLLWKQVHDKRKKESEDYQRVRENILLYDEVIGDSDEERALDEGAREIPVAHTQRQNASRRMGPMDLYVRNPHATIARNKKEKEMMQTSVKEVDPKLKEGAYEYIARFWYQAGIAFNVANLESFQEMIWAIGAYGPQLKAPTFHDLRVPLLNKELERTHELLKPLKEQWGTVGCSIMSDAWTDRKQRSIINFLVNSSKGTMFLKSIDASDYVKSGEKIFELLDNVVEEIGEDKVVQVITDNESNYVYAGKRLEEKRPHLYWTPCVAHCLDLMLEDIGKLPKIKKTIQRAIFLVGFIYGHSSTLSLLRYHTKKRELVRHAITRFATSYLTLQRIFEERANIRRMFVSDDWTKNKLSNKAKGKEATKIVLMDSFWDSVKDILMLMAPIVHVLRLVDGEKKPAMGYIYEAMEKAKETIMKSFGDDEKKYKEAFEIIDHRWTIQLHRPLHAAGHFLNPEFFYSNPKIEFDVEVNTGLLNCITRLVPSFELQQKISDELPIYKSASGVFGNPLAISSRSRMAPAQWWGQYGSSAPNLQKFAMKILSLTCITSGCERNWSTFEQIHTKKRNRLEHKRLHNLVFVKYNQQLLRNYNYRKEIDPISLNGIDECNEWLLGRMEADDDDVGTGHERVFEDDDGLDWATVARAAGVDEPSRPTRSSNKRAHPIASASAASKKKKKKGSTIGSSSGKSKGKVVEEVEYEDVSEESEEEWQELLSEEEDSEGEEREGYAEARLV